MRQFRSGKATLDIQFAGLAIGENCFHRGLWLHATNLRLPLIRLWRAQVARQVGPDPSQRFADIRKNPLLD